MSKSLVGKIALVTGASRGIGRGIAIQLGQAGATVYITGRKPNESLSNDDSKLPSLETVAKDIEARGGKAGVIYTDHGDMDQVKSLFEQIQSETNGQLDILVNNAYAGVPTISENLGKKFYTLEPEVWDVINNVGLRNHYFCSVYAARMMSKNRTGLIVNISSAGAIRYFLNVAYGVGKAGMDRMAVDMAIELKSDHVTVISLWPGAVKTELMTDKKMGDMAPILSEHQHLPEDVIRNLMESGESTEYAGMAIAALAADPHVHKMTGKVLSTADLGDKYGFTDTDGRKIQSMRSLRFILTSGITGMPFGKAIGKWIPGFIKVPGWIVSAHESAL